MPSPLPKIAPPPSPLPISLIILSGGQGRRMGGVNKALMPYQGQPMLLHILQRACPLFAQIIVIANQDLDQIQTLIQQTPCADKIAIHADLEDGFQGPLMGIATGLQFAHFPTAQLWPVDAPGDLITWTHTLWQAWQQKSNYTQLLLPKDPQRWQPLFAMLSTSLLPQIQAALHKQQRGVTRCFTQLPYQAIKTASGTDFTNLNTPEQLTDFT